MRSEAVVAFEVLGVRRHIVHIDGSRQISWRR